MSNSGGAVAIRGFLVQTLVALLDIAKSNPPFTEITLEPKVGDNQFDFLWQDANGSHATQVKSTQNIFTKADVEKWAKKLQDAHTNESCTLVLVGNIHTSLAGLEPVGKVALKQKPLDLDGLIAEAAHRLAEFMQGEGLDEGKATQRTMVVHAIESKLQHLSTGATVLTRESFIARLRDWITSAPKTGIPADISRIIKYAPAELIGREDETASLEKAWSQVTASDTKRPRIFTFVALGGEGKTSLVAKWGADLAHQDWPGCAAVFAWSFYSQGSSEQSAVSSDLFLAEALIFFGDAAMARSAAGAFDKGRRLAQLVGERPVLLILDGLEPLQYGPTSPMAGGLKDQGLAALLKGLAQTNRGLCIVTTRYRIQDLKAFWETTAPQRDLLRLSTQAGVALLQHLGVRRESGSKEDFEKLVEDVKGHALTLCVIGAYLHEAHAGDIRRRDRVKLEEADAEQGGHAFRVMEAYTRSLADEGETGHRALAVLRCLGLFDRPASADCFTALRKAPYISGMTKALVGISEVQFNVTLSRLEKAKLITVKRETAGTLISLDAHSLLREYFAQERRSKHPEAFRAAHQRLYEHLCATTKDKPDATLEDLQPLYQAVAHGCQAGLQREAFAKVYYSRIIRGEGKYAVRKLGAFGFNLESTACFFETKWNRVSPVFTENDQAWLLNEAAFSLRALGRLTEAIEPMRAGMDARVKLGQFDQASISASNLSALGLALGDMSSALREAEQSVTYADRSGSPFDRLSSRSTEADALHQSGYLQKAKERFRESERIHAMFEPNFPLLYSRAGFRYCDLLLTEAERAAWQFTLNLHSPYSTLNLLTSSRVVSKRAAQALKWEEGRILDIALDHLTLSRAALCAAILESGRGVSPLKLAKTECWDAAATLDSAVSGLRRASSQEHIPRGLLTRAWQRSLTGARTGTESAQSDLDEAWEIAERGPMPLFLADIHLRRARLFLRETIYPWNQNPDGTPRGPADDLAAARRLIEKHGYWRRKEELEDAEAALRSCRPASV